jgi:hypothetical protein
MRTEVTLRSGCAPMTALLFVLKPSREPTMNAPKDVRTGRIHPAPL